MLKKVARVGAGPSLRGCPSKGIASRMRVGHSSWLLERHTHAENSILAVESRMGAVAWGLWPTPRFPSPLIKPGVPISGTRLSDRLHRRAHNRRPIYAGVARRHLGPVTRLRQTIQLSLMDPDRSWCLQAHRQSPSPCHLQKHTRSQGPSLRRRYPASLLV